MLSPDLHKPADFWFIVTKNSLFSPACAQHAFCTVNCQKGHIQTGKCKFDLNDLLLVLNTEYLKSSFLTTHLQSNEIDVILHSNNIRLFTLD